MTDLTKGILSAIIASISIAFMGVFVKFTGTGFDNFTLLFFRFFISLIIILPLIYKDKNFTFKIKYPFLYLWRVIFGFLAIGFYFLAIQKIPLVNAILLESTYPVFVPIVIFLLTREKTNSKVILGILISFVGIILILKPNRNIIDINSLIGLAAGICAAISYVFLRLILYKDKTQANNVLFYFFLFCSIVSFPIMLYKWHNPTTEQILLLIGIGVSGYGYQFFITKALKHASVKVISPLIYVSVIVGGISDWLFWGTTISYLTFIGAIITVFGAIIAILCRDKIIISK
jgi:drug/metabolite transporter (DMT)-like permease